MYRGTGHHRRGRAHGNIAFAGRTLSGMFSLDLAVNAIVAGLLLGALLADRNAFSWRPNAS